MSRDSIHKGPVRGTGPLKVYYRGSRIELPFIEGGTMGFSMMGSPLRDS